MFSIVIDGNNVAYYNLENSKELDAQPKLQHLREVIDYCQKKSYDPIILVSPKLRYYIDKPQELHELLKTGVIQETPAGVVDDIFLLETARVLRAYIITNDLFKEYKDNYPEVYHQRLPFMFINNHFILPLAHKENLVKDHNILSEEESDIAVSNL